MDCEIIGGVIMPHSLTVADLEAELKKIEDKTLTVYVYSRDEALPAYDVQVIYKGDWMVPDNSILIM